MKIDLFYLYILLSGIIGFEAGFLDARAHLSGFWVFFGTGPEGILGALGVQVLGYVLFREKQSQ